jgi:hypothetical protein
LLGEQSTRHSHPDDTAAISSGHIGLVRLHVGSKLALFEP